jgi:hypothetical protein
MNTHAPKRIPCVTFEITDLLHQRSSSGVLTLGFSQITQGAGFTARRCPVAPPKRGPGPAPRRALRLDDPLVATPLIAGSERTHLPMSARSIPCMSLRCLHGHPCMTGGGAHSAEADDFPPAMAVALVTWVSQMATNTIGSSIPFPPRLGAPCCLCWCSAPTTLLPPRCSGPSPVHGADRRDVGYGRIS